MTDNKPLSNDPWRALRSATTARVALGRVGGSVPTHEWLDFKQAHAAARDAVHYPFDADALATQIEALGCDVVVVNSAAPDRAVFLKRPDLGRQLDDAAIATLRERQSPHDQPDLAIVVSDGLSAMAVHRQAVPLLQLLLPKLHAAEWMLTPTVVVRFGRVAIQDSIGQLLGAKLALILIGERPGLGSPDSLGAYLVHTPQQGNTDAQRNCVSNIRQQGLSHAAAAETICHLLSESRRRGLSGVHLKDERALAPTESPSGLLERK